MGVGSPWLLMPRWNCFQPLRVRIAKYSVLEMQWQEAQAPAVSHYSNAALPQANPCEYKVLRTCVGEGTHCSGIPHEATTINTKLEVFLSSHHSLFKHEHTSFVPSAQVSSWRLPPGPTWRNRGRLPPSQSCPIHAQPTHHDKRPFCPLSIAPLRARTESIVTSPALPDPPPPLLVDSLCD